MRKDTFEKLYGYLYRSLAKSILSEFDRKSEEEYLTIGIFQFNSFNDGFYYAPTLKNSLLFPTEISDEVFPTSKSKLWNFDLMRTFGKFLSQSTMRRWVNELLDDDILLENNNASSYGTTFESYSVFRNKWREWFNNSINHFDVEEGINVNSLLINQLFYFGNYLITITRKAAYVAKSAPSERTYAESTYMIIHNPQLIGEPKYFNSRSGVLDNGNDIAWKSEPRTQELKSKLIFALEVCYRWPFGIADKITELKRIYGHGKIDNSNLEYLMNATATPLIYNGEFLGICYLSQSLPKTKGNEDFKLGHRSKSLIEKIKESSINGFLYNSRFETARIALQRIDKSSFQKSTIERIFELCHIYSSSPLVGYIDHDSDKLFFRCTQGNSLVKNMSTQESGKTSSELIGFLCEHFGDQNFPKSKKEDYHWFDICEKPIKPKEDAKDALALINLFNDKLSNFLTPSINFNFERVKITSICFLQFEINESFYTLVFFNSNFHIVFNPTFLNPRIKKSYALRNHNNIRLLIEYEQVHRKLHEQSLQFQEDLRKGLLHYFKGSLLHKIMHYCESNFTENKLNTILENCKIIHDRIVKIINVYNTDWKGKITNLLEVYKCWNECLIGYDDSCIGLEKKELNSFISTKVVTDTAALFIIFEEQIQNAFNVYAQNPAVKLRLQLCTFESGGVLDVSVICHGSNMQTKYLEKAGMDSFSSSMSSGYGYVITERLLEKSEAIKMGKKHFELRNSISPKQFEMNFKLKTV